MMLKLPEEDIAFQIARLELQPGDVLVVRAARIVSSMETARLRAYIERVLSGTKVLVIDPGLELSVASKNEAKKLAIGGK